jgi:tricorn protease
MPRAYTGAYSADGKRVAYEEVSTGDVSGVDRGERMASLPRRPHASHSRDERGGQLRHEAAVDRQQRLVSDVDREYVYFLSDRAFTTNLFAYNSDTKEVKADHASRRLRHRECVGRSDAIVYEQAGYIHLVDAKTGQSSGSTST